MDSRNALPCHTKGDSVRRRYNNFYSDRALRSHKVYSTHTEVRFRGFLPVRKRTGETAKKLDVTVTLGLCLTSMSKRGWASLHQSLLPLALDAMKVARPARRRLARVAAEMRSSPRALSCRIGRGKLATRKNLVDTRLDE